MDNYSLNVTSPIVGGYFSSEQIDLLSIIQCQTLDELIEFVIKCDQINRVAGIFESINGLDLESAKRKIFKAYQDTMVYHDQDINASIRNKLNYLGLSSKEELISVIEKTHPRSAELLALQHHFVSQERDQNKAEDLYDELSTLNSALPFFNSMLIGSGKISCVINKYETDPDKKFDFYSAQRDLAFAFKNKKQVRFHSLLVKDDGGLFENKTKKQIKDLIKAHVEACIKFITEYNEANKIIINGHEEPAINAVDLFNEIVSFDKNEEGKYYNIWEEKYGLTMEDLMECFDFALANKPKGVSYIYNEPFLEDYDRRGKVLQVLSEMTPGLIDTLGSQMHITIKQDLDSIKTCFEDFRKLQESGMKIQITEFDMSLGKFELPSVYGPTANATFQQVYEAKTARISEISRIINESGVQLTGVSYWSLTDGIDCNLERIRSKALSKHDISDIKEIPTACGGLIPTHKKLIKLDELNQSVDTLDGTPTPTGMHM